MRFLPGNAQHVGARAEQEDSFGFSDPSDRSFVAHAGMVAVVADGIGGLSNGGAASATAVQAFLKAYESKDPAESIADALLRSIQTANRAVRDLSSRTSMQDKLGTTLAAVVIHEDWLYWVSAGDSRVYFCQDGHAIRLTTDHVYAKDLEVEVARGRITREQASNDPQRDALTSYLGRETVPRVDRSVRAFPIKLGDGILICTDGLYRSLSDEEIASDLQQDPQETCETLVQHALSKQHATQDNITVISLRCAQDEAPFLARSFKPLAVAGALALCAAAVSLFWWWSAPGIRQFSVDRSSILAGQSAVLRWSVDKGTVRITPEIGHVDQKSGARSVSPSRNTSYKLIARNFFRSASRTLDVKVIPLGPPVIGAFLADPAIVQPGGSVKLSWNVGGKDAQVKLNDKTVKANDSKMIRPAKSTSYTLTAVGPGGQAGTTLTVTVSQPKIIFTVTPKSIPAGKSVTLAWSVKDASNISISPALGGAKLKPQDSRKVNLSATITYTLTAIVAGNPTNASVTVTVLPPRNGPLKISSFTADKPGVRGGGTAMLQWAVAGYARSVTIDGGIGAVPPAGSREVTPTAKTTYTLTAVGHAGSTVRATVTVDVLRPPSIELFEAVNDGQTWRLRWQVTGADGPGTRIVIDPGIGPVAASSPPEGRQVAPPPKEGYTLTAEGPGGTASKVAVAQGQPASQQ